MPSHARRILQHNAIRRRKRKTTKCQRGKSLRNNPITTYNLADRPLNYDTYLRGSHWLHLRKEVLAERPVCEHCGTDRRLQLHHTYYYKDGKSVLYRERQHPDVFLVLCHDCHMSKHGAA